MDTERKRADIKKFSTAVFANIETKKGDLIMFKDLDYKLIKPLIWWE